MKTILIATILVGCVPPDVTEKGPEVHVTLDSDDFGNDASDEESNPVLALDEDTHDYTFVLVVDTSAGTKETMAKDTYDFAQVPVAKIAGTLTVPGFEIPPSMEFTVEGETNRTFTSKDPIALPATLTGQILHVTMQGEDADGLHSNVVDFGVDLR